MHALHRFAVTSAAFNYSALRVLNCQRELLCCYQQPAENHQDCCRKPLPQAMFV
jgi:hypothetical protein